MRHAQLFADLAQVVRHALVFLSGTARNHLERADFASSVRIRPGYRRLK